MCAPAFNGNYVPGGVARCGAAECNIRGTLDPSRLAPRAVITTGSPQASDQPPTSASITTQQHQPAWSREPEDPGSGTWSPSGLLMCGRSSPSPHPSTL